MLVVPPRVASFLELEGAPPPPGVQRGQGRGGDGPREDGDDESEAASPRASFNIIHVGSSPEEMGEDVEATVKRLVERKRARETRQHHDSEKDRSRDKWCH